MKAKELVVVAKATAREFGKDDIGYMAAALTYYAFFGVFPLLLLGVTLTTLVIDSRDAQDFIFTNVAAVMPGSVNLLQTTLTEAMKHRGSVGIITLIGLVTLLYSASGAFSALDKAINRAWDTEKVPTFVSSRIASFVMMVVVAALLVMSTLLSTTIAYLKQFASYLLGDLPGSDLFWPALNFVSSVVVIFTGLVLLYRFVPHADITFRDTWVGALIASVVWSIAKEGFAFYVGSSFANYDAVYGTLGAAIALLTWIYVSSLIILTGAEFCSETAHLRALEEKQATSGGGGRAENDPGDPEGRASPWLPFQRT